MGLFQRLTQWRSGAPEAVPATTAEKPREPSPAPAAVPPPAEAQQPGAASRPWPESSVLLAQELHLAGRNAEALRTLDAVIAALPEHAAGWRGRGIVLLALDRAREAADAFERVLALVGATPEGLANRAAARQRLGDARGALRDLDAALQLAPDDHRARVNRIGVLIDLMRLDEALAAADDALRTSPDDAEVHWNRGLVQLLRGELREGWVDHEWRRRIPAFRAKMAAWPQPEWKGQDLQGRTLLLYAEQGFGDTLQFVRFVPGIAARAKAVCLVVPETLAPLLQRLAPNCRILRTGEPMPACDFQCALPSVPAVLQLSLADIPSPVSYVTADPQRVAYWSQRLAKGSGPAVGLVWSGNPAHVNDHNRSIPLQRLQPLAAAGCRFVSLQPEVRESDRATYEGWPGLQRWGEELRDFADTAALVSALDLVITVDTSVAHLCGALGRPVWLLLPYSPDWRWLAGRADSPWYPSARLFRQPMAGAWEPVVARVHMELGRRAAPAGAAAGSDAQPAAEHLRAGNAALEAGDLAAAAARYRQAVALSPGDPVPRVNLGYALLELGQGQAACEVLQEASALGGGADADYLLGQAHAAQGAWPAARVAYLAALAERHDFGFAWRDLGAALEHLGEGAAALEAYESAVRHDPGLVDALGACARLALELGHVQEALVQAARWGERAPGDGQAHFTSGQALLAAERWTEALAALERAAELAGPNPSVAHARGNALFRLGRLGEAADAYALALAGAPDWIESLLNRGIALDRMGRYEEALVSFDRLLALQPDHPKALYARVMTLVSLDRLPEALEAAATGRRLHPGDADMEWHYGVACALAGRLEEAWPAFEARWRAKDIGVKLERQAFPQPEWTGQPLSGKTLLVYPEQGLGDVLQFARFVPVLEAMGARVLLWTPASLQALVATVSPTATVAARVQDLPAFDYHCPIMSLPLPLGTTLQTLPAKVPYLRGHPERREHWARRVADRRGLHVGLVWSGNARHGNDHNRSLPLRQMRQLAQDGIHFVSLQPEIRESDRTVYESWPGLLRWGEELRDFADTAALIETLDLVITVDTSVAHVAGAAGRPFWVLLPLRPDWRWLLRREDSPWYPTARLFRQQSSREWDPVLARMREALAGLAGAR